MSYAPFIFSDFLTQSRFLRGLCEVLTMRNAQGFNISFTSSYWENVCNRLDTLYIAEDGSLDSYKFNVAIIDESNNLHKSEVRLHYTNIEDRFYAVVIGSCDQ